LHTAGKLNINNDAALELLKDPNAAATFNADSARFVQHFAAA